MTKAELQFERNLAIKMIKKGYKRAEIVKLSELSESTLRHLFADFKKMAKVQRHLKSGVGKLANNAN